MSSQQKQTFFVSCARCPAVDSLDTPQKLRGALHFKTDTSGLDLFQIEKKKAQTKSPWWRPFFLCPPRFCDHLMPKGLDWRSANTGQNNTHNIHC